MEGGTPVRNTYLPYGAQSISEEDVAAVTETLRSGWITTGPKVREFEGRVAEYVGARYAVALSSGTAALHAAAFAAAIGPGDEVITTPLTFAASANCVLFQGGRPVFADVEPDTLNLDAEEARKHITKRTKAIIAVDYAGHPCDMEKIRRLADSFRLLIIQDAAHSLGAEYQGERIGSLADLTTFSFHPVKHITTGEGGMVTTNDPSLAQRARMFRNHGLTTEASQRREKETWFYEMAALGYNYRLTDIQCALGLSQMGRLEAFLERRAAIVASYNAAFAEVPEVSPPPARKDVRPAWHIYVLRLNLERLRADRDEIARALWAENIGVNVHYIPVYYHPYYKELGYEAGCCPVAEDAYRRIITLPLFPSMTDADADDVIHAVMKVVRHFRGAS